MDLEVRDLRLVAALIEAKTTARAAKALHLSQPSISRALLKLEERLDTKLFERGARGLEPTAAGRRLAFRGRDVLDALGDLELAVRQPAEPLRVRLVCECYTAYHWLPAFLQQLRRSQPELEVSLLVEHTEDAVDALRRGDIDAALVTSEQASDETIVVRQLLSDEMLFVVARDHALAQKPSLQPNDLLHHRLFIPRPTRAESRWFMRSIFGKKRPHLEVSVIPVTEALVELARAGMGIAFMTEWVVGPYLRAGDLVAMRMKKGPMRRPWSFAWRRELGDAGARLLAALPRTVHPATS